MFKQHPGNSSFLAFAVAIRRISQINILRFRGVVSEYQVAHLSFLMTSKTSFHNRFVCCLSLQLTISCRARQHNWGSAKSALHLTLNLCTFLGRRCVMNKRRIPFRSWQVSGARTKNMDKSGCREREYARHEGGAN